MIGSVIYDVCGTEDDDILTGEQIDNDAESEPHVGKGKPGENEGENLVLVFMSA
jgi:hypothetical protein